MGFSRHLSGQRILVTGASGFLGSHLCHRLSENGAEVHAVSRNFRASQTRSLHWWQGDMAEIAAVNSLLRDLKPEVIFHLSGLSTASPKLELVWPTLHSLFISTVNLLTVAAEIGCGRLVLLEVISKPTDWSMVMPCVAKQNGRAAHGMAKTDPATMGSDPRPSPPTPDFPPRWAPAGG